MLQLAKSGARYHALDCTDRFVATQADGIGRSSEPNPATAALDRASQGAVIDDLSQDGFDSTRTRQRRRTNQDATSRRSRGLAPGISNPRRWVQQEEEKHERR